MQNDEWFPLDELNERVAGLVWVEAKVSEVLMAWSSLEPVPKAAILFATAGRHHQWHCEVLTRCLATSPQLQSEHIVVPPTAGWEQSIAKLASLVDEDATSTRLRALVKVVNPWIARETAVLLELSRPISDAALLRWLRFVEIDHHDDGAAAAEVLAAVGDQAIRFDDHVVVNELDLS